MLSSVCLRGESLCRSSCLRACFHVRGCLCSQVRHRSGFACGSHKGSGSHVHFRPRPSSSTDRWARLTTDRHLGPHNTVKSVLSCPQWPHRHRMCVTTKGLGCPHKLAHAARDGHFLGDLTSEYAALPCWLSSNHGFPNWP